MASDKKRQKATRQAKKKQQPHTAPFRHADGDRRHRGAERVEDAIARKHIMHQFYGAVLPPTDGTTE